MSLTSGAVASSFLPVSAMRSRTNRVRRRDLYSWEAGDEFVEFLRCLLPVLSFDLVAAFAKDLHRRSVHFVRLHKLIEFRDVLVAAISSWCINRELVAILTTANSANSDLGAKSNYMIHDFVFPSMGLLQLLCSPHRHREPRASAEDRAVIENAHGLSIPCASEVNHCRFLVECTSECSGVHLQQRYDIFAFDTVANRAHRVVIRTVRKICDIQQNRFETLQ